MPRKIGNASGCKGRRAWEVGGSDWDIYVLGSGADRKRLARADWWTDCLEGEVTRGRGGGGGQ